VKRQQLRRLPAEDVAPESTEPETEAPAEIETEVSSDDVAW
jgi:hypothetical protein